MSKVQIKPTAKGKMTFVTWLLKQKGRDDPVGDLAEDARVDRDNGRRLYELIKHDHKLIKHDHKYEVRDQAFFRYDGARWTSADTMELDRRSKKIPDIIRAEATEPAGKGKLRNKGAYNKWAIKTASHPARQKAILAVREMITCKNEDFDPDPYLLNLENATLDLRTLKGRKHKPADLITCLVPITANAKARCPKFLEFLRTICEGNQAKIDYLQETLGSTLLAGNQEQVIYIDLRKNKLPRTYAKMKDHLLYAGACRQAIQALQQAGKEYRNYLRRKK